MKSKLLILLLSILPCMAFNGAAEQLPKVLIIGDSIAGGYLPHLKELLKDKAVVTLPVKENGETFNCEGTTKGVREIESWMGDTKWDVIHFNFGLHDIKHIDPETGKNSKNLNHPQQANPEQYRKNLEEIVGKLKASGARLIFATTTPYPDTLGKQMRSPGMPKVYNEIALEIMRDNEVEVNDLYSFVLPRMEELQRPNNVHFTEPGSEALAEQVAKVIGKHLEQGSALTDQPDEQPAGYLD